MKVLQSLNLACLLVLFASCDSKRVYEQNIDIPDYIWDKENAIYFDVPIIDTVSLHNVYINIRNASGYGYSNIYLFLDTKYPNNTISRDTIECILADPSGKWLGDGSGDIWDNQILFKKNVRFKQVGTYKFRYEQAMRMPKLPMIMDVGLRIEKAVIMLVKSYGSAVYGVNATTITVEIDVSAGFKYFHVGLPDNAVKESQQRVTSALKHVGYKMPGKRIVINMAPADIRKEGSSYDLTIAVGILAGSEQIFTEKLGEYIIMGELSLDGMVQPIKGALPIAIQAKKEGFKGFILPQQNAREAAIVSDLEVYGVTNLSEVIEFLIGEKSLERTIVNTREEFFSKLNETEFDFCDVKGQENIKRALEIAAAGGHNAILVGPPGAGKTMLAKRLPTILPPLTIQESLETTKIHSVAGKMGKNNSLITVRPFRSPHHTISDVALVGGGGVPQPGEISLAHNGVLFLDELPEFKRTVLEVMRQPLEEKRIMVSRAKFSVEYPASFMLIAAMNPCPCGYYNHPEKECVCAPGVVQRYLNKISGPLLDRIDIHVEVTPVAFGELTKERVSEKSASVRERVIKAREMQEKRFAEVENVHCNAQMTAKKIQAICKINDAGRQLLKTAMERLGLSARAYDSILKVSRTIADLDGAEEIQNQHLAEAIQYRSLDRESWAG